MYNLLSILDKCTHLKILELRLDSLPYKKAEPWKFIQNASSYKALLKLKHIEHVRFWMRPLKYYVDSEGEELEYLRVGRGDAAALTKEDENKIRSEFRKWEEDNANHFSNNRKKGNA